MYQSSVALQEIFNSFLSSCFFLVFFPLSTPAVQSSPHPITSHEPPTLWDPESRVSSLHLLLKKKESLFTLSLFSSLFSHLLFRLLALHAGGGRLEVRCHGDRQNLPLGVCDRVRPGNRGPLPPASLRLRLVTAERSGFAAALRRPVVNWSDWLSVRSWPIRRQSFES